MADNVTLDGPGSGGATIAADDITSVWYQRVKITDGVADSTLALGIVADDVAVVAADTGILAMAVATPTDTAVDANDTGYVAMSLDRRLHVDSDATLQAGTAEIGSVKWAGTAPPIGAGTEAAALRVTLATDSTGVVSIDDNGGSLTVDGTITEANSTAILADTAAIDTATAAINAKLVTGTVIGDVNLGAVDNAVLDTINTAVELIDNAVYVENAALGATPSGNLVMARQDAALTATGSIDDDATPLTVDANGALWVIPSGTVTVAGTVTANPASGTIDTVSTVTTCNLAAETTKVIGTVNVAAAQTIAATNAGTFATQVDGAALTALQLIDDAVVAIDAVGTSAKVMMQGAIRDDTLSALVPVEGDAVPLRVGSTGALHVTGAGGGTQYTVDDAGPTTVTMAGAVRDDALTTLTEIDGDATLLRVSSTGALHVTGGGGGTEYTEDVATANPIVGTATLMERDDALATLTPIEGDWASFRCSAEGALWTQDFNSDANLAANVAVQAAVEGTLTVGSHAVTNAGTFATQAAATLTAETTKVIGTVNVAAAQTIATTNAGTFATQSTLQAGTAGIGKLTANSGVDIGDVDVTSCALPTGAATAALQDAHATGGMSFHMLAMAAEDNDAVIKASAATVYFVSIQSIDATPVYLKLFNAASITPGTTAADLQFMAPSQGTALGAGLTLNFGPHGIQFATGLCALVSTGIATTSNTAVSANEVIVTIGYE